ncbi:MAG: magnesium transporter [Candidatus Aenigmarchaeota archaeon]|nr:magnesium transporter [Candidatus Aenigmarchaeota archaeon]
MDRDFREILTTELISVTGGLLAGVLLAFATNQIELIPGVLILLPGFLEMRGNISGSLSGRLSSGLFLGALKPEVRNNRVLRGNIAAALLLVILVSTLLGIVAYAATYYVFGIGSPKIILIAFAAGLLSSIIEIPLTIITTFWLFRHGHDPNNIMGPYVTTTGDIVSIASLLFAMVIV